MGKGKNQTSVGKAARIAFARSGGKAVLEQKGRNHFRDLANKRWERVRAEKKQ